MARARLDHAVGQPNAAAQGPHGRINFALQNAR